jgi:endogenous inhibitor of DNA gyrase (YacG/DUF329 family)
MITISCEQCGESFNVKPYRALSGSAKYCSRKCHDIAQTSRILIKCYGCGNEVSRKPSSILGHTFCGRKCYEIWQKTRPLNARDPIIEETHAMIPLTRRLFTIVDEKNADLSKHNWKLLKCVSANITKYYAVRTTPARATALMHRVILERELGRTLNTDEEVDHIDGDGLNNLVSNLRPASRENNAQNISKRSAHRGKPSTSIYKGVSYKHDTKKKWRARIGHRLIGRYGTEEEAANAYDIEALNAFGEFAKLNFPIGRLAGKVMRKV